jgi:regulator of protease activity HflC (stomatin/prohibitin superfamily)
MVVLLVLSIIVVIVGLYMTQAGKGKAADPRSRLGGQVAVIAGIVGIVVTIIAGSFAAVPAGHRGVVIRFNAVTGDVLEEGLQMKLPFLDSVEMMSVRTDKYEVGAASASRDLQDVKTTIALNWRLEPTRTAEIYRTLGTEYIPRIAAPAVQEVIKQVTARYPAEDLILKREAVRDEIAGLLTTRLLERGIIVEAVSITEFQFSSTFVAAIEAKVAAEQAVWEARNKLERVKVEAEQNEAQAKGDASARIARANGEAEYIRIVTDAQVAANKAVAASLTPEVLQYILLDRLGADIKVMIIPSGQGLSLVVPEIKP